MPGCTSVEIGLVFGIDRTILRSPGPSHGSKFNKNATRTFLMYYKVIVGVLKTGFGGTLFSTLFGTLFAIFLR